VVGDGEKDTGKPVIETFEGHSPRVDPGAFVHERAVVIGRVTLAAGTSVWPGAVLRGDIEPITVAEGANIQDNAVLHTDPERPVIIGRGVTVGHGALLHGCTVGDDALIGMGAIVLNGARVEPAAMVGAGALVPPGARVDAGHLVLGSPARSVRPLSDQEKSGMRDNALRYRRRAALYRAP
jgi:carbonic anhydrase/acetyltransferase-like protein (isoleucine patch superfamily)